MLRYSRARTTGSVHTLARRSPLSCTRLSVCVFAAHEASITRVILAIYRDGHTNADEALERYVFDLRFLLALTDEQRSVIIKDNISLAELHHAGRAFLLKILALEALLPPPENEQEFRVHIETDSAQPEGLWVPTEGVTHGRSFRVGRPGSVPLATQRHVHPIYMLESGVIDVRRS